MADHRRVRRRLDEAQAALDAYRAPDRDPRAVLLGQVYNAGHEPSTGNAVFAVHIVKPTFDEVEGAAVSTSAVGGNTVFSVLGGKPSDGDVLIADRIGRAWVAEKSVLGPVSPCTSGIPSGSTVTLTLDSPGFTLGTTTFPPAHIPYTLTYDATIGLYVLCFTPVAGCAPPHTFDRWEVGCGSPTVPPNVIFQRWLANAGHTGCVDTLQTTDQTTGVSGGITLTSYTSSPLMAVWDITNPGVSGGSPGTWDYDLRHSCVNGSGNGYPYTLTLTEP